MGEVGFDVGFDGGAGAREVAQPVHFVGDELIVGRALHGQEALEEIHDPGRLVVSGLFSASSRPFAYQAYISVYAIYIIPFPDRRFHDHPHRQ